MISSRAKTWGPAVNLCSEASLQKSVEEPSGRAMECKGIPVEEPSGREKTACNSISQKVYFKWENTCRCKEDSWHVNSTCVEELCSCLSWHPESEIMRINTLKAVLREKNYYHFKNTEVGVDWKSLKSLPKVHLKTKDFQLKQNKQNNILVFCHRNKTCKIVNV